MSIEKFDIKNDIEQEQQERREEEITVQVEKEIAEGKIDEKEIQMLQDDLRSQKGNEMSEEEIKQVALEIWKQMEIEKRVHLKERDEKEREERILR